MSPEREEDDPLENTPVKKSRWRYVAGVFLLLLLVSHIIRWTQRDAINLRSDQISLDLPVVERNKTGDEVVTTAYTLLEPDSARYPNPATLVLLHGSPMASMSMMTLAHTLPDSFRILVPDLPGFGRSTRRIPDYSVDAHAVYLNAMLDSLGIGEAHYVAYSMSGGVALQAYARAPEKVASVVMLSAIGVQELELLGSYLMNHAVHALQLGFMWSLQELTPHMGFMDEAILNTSYARNFYDTDQRPLREILTQFEPPMLIMHGEKDMQVPLDAAIEHARIVPQSELALFDGGHGLVFNPNAGFIESLTGFINKVERDEAATRSTATPARIAAANVPFQKEAFPKAEGLTLLVYMLLIALATLVTEDGASIGAGLLVAQGTMNYFPAMLACLIGIVVGDVLLFLAGRHISGPMLSRRPFRWFFSKDAIAGASRWLERRGGAVIIASRFIPGSRLPTYVAAGSLGLPLWKFLLYFIVASILWTPMLVWLAVIFGEQLLTQFLDVYETYAIWVFLGLLVGLLGLFKVVVPLFSHEGRRSLVGSWRRRRQWEFWPMWQFYPPIVLYVLYLGLRYRSFTLFTAANPGIDLGGLVGESKADILNKLADSSKYVARFAAIPARKNVADRVEKVTRFMAEADLTYPIILKPDTGERGKEVAKVYNEGEVALYLESYTMPAIAQAYAPGQEFGVFYYRYPESPKGALFSITDKQFPSVTGNGKHNLRRLIMDDERAVCMAKHYFKANQERLFDVPDTGEVIQLIDIGTHSRGSVFLDGTAIETPALAEAIDQISKSFDGFYFGRYDIRTPNLEDFQRGENFKIVELNGVTSEATHIYDPKHSLFEAYRILRAQWRIAFEIGDQNRKRGVKPASLFEVLGRVIGRS
ncbi:MAG: alpha/beta fold hydrolase [Bacteroidota bacterium]